MKNEVYLVVFPVKDLSLAKMFYGNLLGVTPYADGSYYVGYRNGSQEIGLDPNGGQKGMTGPVVYWEVSDIKESIQSLLDAGGQKVQDITDVGGGRLIAMIKDRDANIIGLMQEP
jgi:predicted enzyme related to lactoylglutathione lyase